MNAKSSGMRLLRAIVLAALTGLAPATAIAGGDQAGTTAANFLAVGAGAGIVGMGGATLGFGSDLNAASWNPAALGRVERTEFVFSHAGLAGQSAQEWASVGGLAGPSRFRWALTGLFQGEGGIAGRDASNNPTGNVDVSSAAFGAQLARPLGPLVTAGLGVKFATEKLGNVSGSGMTFDAGVSARSGWVGFGLAAQNVGGQMKYDAASYPFPTSVGAGVSVTHPTNGMRVALDANFPSAYYSDVRGGVEWRWMDRFALRTGYRAELGAGANEPLNGPTFGMGAGVSGVWIDYGYLLGGTGSGQHRVGLSFHPGAMGWAPTGTDAQSQPARLIEPPVKPSPAPKRVAPPSTAAKPATVKPATAEPETAKLTSVPALAAPPAKPVTPPAASVPGAAAGGAPGLIAANLRPGAPPAAALGTPAAPATKPVTSPAAPALGTPAAPPVKPVPAPAVASTPAVVSALAPAPKPAVAAHAVKAAAPTPAIAKPVSPPAPLAKRETQALAKPAILPPAPMPALAVKTEMPAAPPVAKPTAPEAVAAIPAPTPVSLAPEPLPEATVAPAASEPKPLEQKSAPEVKTAAPTPILGGPAPEPKPSAATPVKRPAKVTVKKGETLETIAQQWNTSVPAIMMENNLVKAEVRPGQSLKLPNHK